MVDIIIPFFNKCELTIQCLNSVIKTFTLNCELIIVDDGSDVNESKEVFKYLQECGASYKFIKNERNEGFKSAVRTAMRLCKNKYVILLNNDTITTPGFDNKLIEVLESVPEIRAAGPVSNHPTDLFQFRSILNDVRFELPSTTQNQRQLLNNTSPAIGKKRFTYSPYLTGMCLAIDRQLFVDLGIFDDIYEHGYFEDLDLCCQIREKGYKLAIVEDCFVFHYGHATYRQKATEEKHRIIWNNFGIFNSKWSHFSGHDELLLKMEYAGQHDPI